MSGSPENTSVVEAAPKWVLFSSLVLLGAALWLLLCCRNGKPVRWLGELAYFSAFLFSLIGSPSLFLLSGMDLRRGNRARVNLLVLACSVSSTLLVGSFLWLRLRGSVAVAQ